MLPLENYQFSATGPKPNQDTIPAGVTLAGDFGFCFQCQVGSSLVLRRSIEITKAIGINRHLEGWLAGRGNLTVLQYSNQQTDLRHSRYSVR